MIVAALAKSADKKTPRFKLRSMTRTTKPPRFPVLAAAFGAKVYPNAVIAEGTKPTADGARLVGGGSGELADSKRSARAETKLRDYLIAYAKS
jgi:hypothetical protein